MKTIKDIFKKKSLYSNTISGDAIVIDALAMMEEKNLDFVIVIENNNCVGVLSETDYLHKIILAGKNPYDTKVKDIMTHCIHAVDIEETVLNCLRLMDTFKIRHLLVFEGFLFKGVITLHDLMHASIKENINNIQAEELAKYNIDSNIADNYQHYFALTIREIIK
ncbi:D-arabinose 5-phosphate isomerase [mine drainage metagenome]|uniref:D-arabinose 5-phosphate isomerase n=1 Tax=mine drainage metagenome TaxID=410659 RepID=A0A1J5SB78_9ZZZZ